MWPFPPNFSCPVFRQDRVRIEAEALREEGRHCPDHVPTIFHYSEPMALIAMQYLAPPAIILRQGLIKVRRTDRQTDRQDLVPPAIILCQGFRRTVGRTVGKGDGQTDDWLLGQRDRGTDGRTDRQTNWLHAGRWTHEFIDGRRQGACIGSQAGRCTNSLIKP
jgi:hypothetical protein